MRHITYALLLAMLVVLAACKKENLDKDNTTINATPKEGLELLTTNADTSYFIWAGKKDTFIYRSSDGLNFSVNKGNAMGSTGNRFVQYGTTAMCPSGPYESLTIRFRYALANGEKVDSTSLERLIVPGRYNIGEQTGEVFMVMYARDYNIQAWTDVSSTELPIEIVSVKKVGFKDGRNVYRIRGRVVAKCAFGCPLLWVSMYQGAFQFDAY